MLMPRQMTPGLTLETVAHGSFDLASEKAERGTVICFYRGLHCPICATYLKELERLTPDFEQRGVTTIAVSSDDKERASAMAEKLGGEISALPMVCRSTRPRHGASISRPPAARPRSASRNPPFSPSPVCSW